MTGDTDRASVRLAELVAALSLGVDLGFGQPMEHVLRQCLIALRLAERIGLDDEQRADVYYTALARQCRLSLRRARAGEVVRRRHRVEVGEVRPRARKRARRGGGVPTDRFGQPAVASVPGRARVHARRTSRRRRDGARARSDRPPARRAAQPVGGRARIPRERVRAVERSRLARRAEGRRGSAGRETRAAGGVQRGRTPRRRRRGGEGARTRTRRQAVRSRRWPS